MLNRNIHLQLLSLGIDYINKIKGELKNEQFNLIRDSIILRIRSVLFHYQLLNSINNPNQKIFTESFKTHELESYSIRQKFLFDSIIFNLISIFDYQSCLITYIRETNKDKWKKTWSSLENYTRDNSVFKKTSLGKKIIKVNNDWVSKLSDYRAELIHYQAEGLGSSAKYSLMDNTLDILVLAPLSLKKHFKQLKSIKEKKDYNINAISLWLIKTCLEITLDIQEDIRIFIDENRKLTDEQTVIIVKKN